MAWGLLVIYVVLFFVLIFLALVLKGIRDVLQAVRIPNIIMQPERCASCDGVLSDPDGPVEFIRVPVDAILGGRLHVHFRVCQRCVMAAAESFS